jgi:hypothetical protein
MSGCAKLLISVSWYFLSGRGYSLIIGIVGYGSLYKVIPMSFSVLNKAPASSKIMKVGALFLFGSFSLQQQL